MEDSRKAEEAGVVTLAELATAAGVLYGGLAMDVQKSRAQIVKMLMAREPDWTTDDEVAKDLDDWLSERVTVKAAWDALVEELPAEDRDDDLEVQGAVLRDLIKQGLRVEELRETINTFWETDG